VTASGLSLGKSDASFVVTVSLLSMPLHTLCVPETAVAKNQETSCRSTGVILLDTFRFDSLFFSSKI